jgi:hypothetical protein
MGRRLLAFMCGMLMGAALHALVAKSAPPAAPAATPGEARFAAKPDPRCAAHPVKMPCLSDSAP